MKSFPSKILLFGEHIVNKGAHALAIPYDAFYGKLSFDKQHSLFLEPSTLILDKIGTHIEQNPLLQGIYDLDKLRNDMQMGLCFHLNIPVGYGLGSSGAIVASIFDQYAVRKDFDYAELKHLLGETEGVFHGKSSGLDPLVSYLNQAVLVSDSTSVVKEEMYWKNDFEIFLFDTKQARKTEPLVEAFLKKSNENQDFAKVLENDIVPLNNEIIQCFLSNTHSDTMQKIGQLSRLQFEQMQELILPQHLDYFLLGLASKDYFLKICGAGGGGFMLGFTKNKNVKLPFEVIWL